MHTFTPGRRDGSAWTDEDKSEEFPELRSLIYLHIDVGDGNEISGWVTPEAAKLVKAAPDLLKACLTTLRTVSLCECGESNCATTQLRAAIDKATK